MLAFLFAGLFAVAVAEQGFHSSGRANTGRMFATLTDPLSLFAQRSPGERGSGPLHLTKVKPHERVLSEVRSRPPKGGAAPVPAESPAAATAPGSGLPDTGPVGSTQLAQAYPFLPPDYPYYPPPIYTPSSPPASPPSTPPSTPPTIGAPEPASWTLMIVGLFAAGRPQKRKRIG